MRREQISIHDIYGCELLVDWKFSDGKNYFTIDNYSREDSVELNGTEALKLAIFITNQISEYLEC